jgi:hypothetical protein
VARTIYWAEMAVRTVKWGDQKEGVYIDESRRRHR